MRRVNFRLTLEPGVQGVVRLAQLHRYANDRADEKRLLIGPSLREHIESLFPRRKTEAVLDSLLGNGPTGWALEGAADKSQLVAIKTVGPGVALSTIARIVEHVVPEALAKPMAFAPGEGNLTVPISRHLH